MSALALGAHSGSAFAVIQPATTIDGPSEDILAFGGVAMAEDGTGGIVYEKREGGVEHVFVKRYVGGRWLGPIRVDTEEPFAGSWARIGAADGGELVVVWATPFATESDHPVQELLGATLGPGAAAFGPAQLIDPNIREGTGTSPDLAMSSTGRADVVYRVVNNEPLATREVPLLRPGDVVEEVRAAHFNGERWSSLGAINRNPGASMRAPTEENAPKIAIGPTGNGVVVWQEPEITGEARIWARRLFGSTLDFVLPVSTSAYLGGNITQDADAPSVAVSLLGEAVVAYRQAYGPGSPLQGPRIFLNKLPDGESADGSKFLGAFVADNAPGGPGAVVGPPSIDIDEKQNLRLLYDSNGAPRVVKGTDLGLAGTITLGSGFAGSQASASVMNPAGGGVSAWTTEQMGSPAVAVREDFADGAVQTGFVRGGDGGPVGELGVGRSGLGDGLVGFLQGPVGHAAIVAADVSAPPTQLLVNLPKGWVRPSAATVSWPAATSANGPLTYTVVLDGHPLATPAGASSLSLDRHRLGSGRHQVQLLAADITGADALSAPAPLLIDATPPVVAFSVSAGRGVVRVRVSDAFSGVATRKVSVRFGDRTIARGRTRFTHRYRRAGIYTVSVFVRSRAGSAGVVRRLVSVR